MNKAQKIVAVFFIIVAVIIAILFFISNQQNKNTNLPEGIVLYYGDTCPHCKIVDEFIINNNVSSKINITNKEVFNNPLNQAEFLRVIKQCNIKSSQAGVPLLYSEGTCYSGDVEVIDFIKEKIGVQ